MKKEAQQQMQMTGTSALQLIKNLKDNLSNLTPTQLAQQLDQLEIAVGQLEQLKAKLNQQIQSGSGGTGGQAIDDGTAPVKISKRVKISKIDLEKYTK